MVGTRVLFFAIITIVALAGCTTAPPQAAGVEIVGDTDAGYRLIVNGEPFEIRGAGIGQPSEERFKALVEAGGNAVRTWSASEADTVLELAAKYDVMVALGIDFGQELHGFDYDDPVAVAAQFERVKAQVDRYKDHPNLLVWIIGNELNLLYGENGIVLVNPSVYAALNDVATYIHETDPNHPVSTAFAGYLAEHVQHAMPFAPDLDFLSVQMYGDLANLPKFMAADTSRLPVMLTEYGPLGHWEMPKTSWGREIEEPSAVKAAGLADRIDRFIVGDESGRLIGDFVFFWGHKQERTSTWYSLFTREGRVDSRIDELTKHWTGAYPKNRAPLTKAITIDGSTPFANIVLEAGETYTARIDVTDPEGEALATRWTLRGEVVEKSLGGEWESVPAEVPTEVIRSTPQTFTFRAPTTSGEYRLFAVTSDPHGKVGHANAPFLVK